MKNKLLSGRAFRLSALLLVVCLISTVMLSGTFAKYTSTYAGQDTALVAKWSLTMTDGTTGFAISPATAATLDLFSHTYDTNIIATAGTAKVIAPGVSGDFDLVMLNNSDVAADITFAITTGDSASVNVPMEFDITDNFATGDTLYVGTAALQTALNNRAIQLPATNGTTTQKVYWRWAFDGTTTLTGATDSSDTALGVASALGTGAGTEGRTTYNLNINITATQVVPTP